MIVIKRNTAMVAGVITYLIIASIGCSPMGVTTCEVLNMVNIDTQIALADVDGKNSYGHVYVIINDTPYESRYLGIYLQNNIDYNNPYAIYNSGDEYISSGHTFLPKLQEIINAVMETIR